MNRTIRAAWGWSVALCIVGLGAAGCGSGGSSATGTLSVRMADAPADVEHVYVTFTRVEANGPGGWKELFSSDPNRNPPVPPITVDLRDYVFTDLLLASAPLPAGHYSQIRLFLNEVRLVKEGGSTYPVTLPSGFENGFTIDVNADVAPNAVTELLCDFNAARSIFEAPPGSNSYFLQPVIPTVVKPMSGTISGTVLGEGPGSAANFRVAVFRAGAQMVEANLVNSSQTMEDGSFKVWALLAGTYDVRITSEDLTKTKTVPGVEVTAGQGAALGAVSLAP